MKVIYRLLGLIILAICMFIHGLVWLYSPVHWAITGTHGIEIKTSQFIEKKLSWYDKKTGI